MPSFDAVCSTDMQKADNATNSVDREITNRYDFKGTQCSIARNDREITIVGEGDYHMETIAGMLKTHFTRQELDAKVLDFQTPEKASGNTLRQKVVIREGIDTETAKKIVKEIKASKIKVQASIRGEEVRVEGKKRDDLQQVMQIIRDMNLELPVQFINFRD